MLEIVDLVLEGVRDEVHEHQLLLATRWTGDPGLFLLVLGQKVGQVPVNPRLVSNLIKVRSLVTKHYLVTFHDVEKIKKIVLDKYDHDQDENRCNYILVAHEQHGSVILSLSTTTQGKKIIITCISCRKRQYTFILPV